MKKFVSILLAVMMLFALAISVSAATITVTPPANATGTNTYTVYKVFDVTSNGTAVAYKLVGSDTLTDAMTAAGFVATNGYVTLPSATGDELTADQIAAIKGFVTATDIVGTIETTGTTAGSLENLGKGFYYVETSTGSAVMIETATDTITIGDKNTITVVDKVAGSDYDADSKKAIASVGTDLPFTATITVGKGAHDVVFTDTMVGMTYNEDLKIDGADVTAAVATVNKTETGFTVTFADAYINARNTTGESTIVLTYTGKITAEALTIDAANNTASVTTDEANENTSTVNVFNAKLTVTKYDGKNTAATDDDTALKGAGFKLKNADNEYYIKAADGSISWGTEAEATEVMANTGNGENVAVFTGLGIGTYTLIESTVPDGYNKANDQTITVALTDVTGDTLTLEKTADVINMAGSTLPSTGGIGTTIFYVVGGLLIVAAGVLFITKKRMSHES